MGLGSRKDRGDGRKTISINNSLRFAVRGTENGALATEECEVKEHFFFPFLFFRRHMIAYLYPDMNDSSKRENSVVQEREERIAGTFPEVEKRVWYPVHKGHG